MPQEEQKEKAGALITKEPITKEEREILEAEKNIPRRHSLGARFDSAFRHESAAPIFGIGIIVCQDGFCHDLPPVHIHRLVYAHH